MNVAVNSNATRMQNELTERAVHGSVKVDLYLSSKIIKEGGGRENTIKMTLHLYSDRTRSKG